jgi:hypothetical protein
MRAASIYTAEATDIIDEITGKRGYLFRIDTVFRAVPLEEIKREIAAAKERGGHDAEQMAEIEEFYNNQAEPFMPAGKLTEAEIASEKAELDETIRQLEAEVAELIKRRGA